MKWICTIYILLPAIQAQGNDFYCAQFFQNIRSRDYLSFSVKDNSEQGDVVAAFTAPEAPGERVYLTSPDAEYVALQDSRLVVQGALRPKNGETLVLEGKCDGIVVPYNIIASVDFNITVFVDDANDPPRFSNLPQRIQIYENTSISSVVFDVEIDDSLDIDQRFWTKDIRIEQVTGLEASRPTSSRPFYVTDSNKVRLVNKLDYETGPRIYKLKIVAVDGGYPAKSTTGRLVINVLDVDDMSPEFSRDLYMTTVIGEKPLQGKEECFNVTPPIHAEDLDRGLKSEVVYEITEGDPGTREYWGAYFRLEPTTGMVCQLKAVQRLLHDPRKHRDVFFNFTLTIRAYQQDNPEKSDTAQLVIQVLDENSYTPTFERKLYRKSLPEYPVTTNDSTIVTVVAHDADYGQNSEFEYILVENPGNMFDIDKDRGVIYLTNDNLFDRELSQSFEIKVGARELYSAERHQDTARVVVHVLDVNDNPPEFTNSSYTYSVRDTLRRGSAIHQFDDRPLAVDRDVGENAHVTYEISGVWRLGSPTLFSDLGRFIVDRDTGMVRLAGSISDLRRRRDHPVYRIAVTATDRAAKTSDRLSSTADVYVTIENANDHQPKFVATKTTNSLGSAQVYDAGTEGRYHVTEDVPIGSVIATVNVEDEDGDEDVFLTFWLSQDPGEELFSISSEGRIQLQQRLDREKQSFHKLVILVSDGLYNVSTEVGIFVDDVNDNEPRFDQEEYVFYLEENPSSGSIIGHISATDLDLQEAAEVTYALNANKGADSFLILKDGSLVVAPNTLALDRETSEVFLMKVIASDNGQPELKNSADVTVYLVDANDNPPVLSKSVYMGSVLEDNSQPVAQSVVMESVIEAADDDVTEENRHVVYELSGANSELFVVDRHTGHMTVASPGQLDAEVFSEIRFQIIARDRNGSGIATTSDVVVKVKDVNDNAPHFVDTEDIFVQSNVTTGTKIGRVVAVDNDVEEPNNRVIYVLKNGGFGKFSVDLETGDILVADDLTREPNHENYTLDIHAYDGGVPRLFASTSVNIDMPAANQRPEFLQELSQFRVKENSPLGHVFESVVATDGDVDGAGQTLTYFIKDSSQVPFTVDPKTGGLSVSSVIDYESQRDYHFPVYTRDNGIPPMTSSASVWVKVDDVRDVPPPFLLANYEGRVVENNENPIDDQLVLMPVNISMVGCDLSEVTLSLQGPNSDMFYLDDKTGQIRVSERAKGTIDRERIEKFDFVLRATDKDDPSMYSEVDLTIHVLDVNDNGPVFQAPSYEFHVPEDASVGQELGKVVAMDADSTGPNSEIIYLLDNDAYGKFRVDTRTGSVSIRPGIYYPPYHATYQFNVTAMDMGTPMLKTSQLVTVHAEKPLTARAPSGFLGDRIFSMEEEVVPGTVVGTLGFVGLTPGSNVTLDIVSQQPVPFVVNSLTGEVRTSGRLDYDSGQRSHTFVVMATDAGHPPREIRTTVGVILEDINDNPPRFTQAEYRHRVSTNFPAGTVVATPFAYDDVDSTQSAYTYSLEGEGAGVWLVVDPQTGVVSTTERLAEAAVDVAEAVIYATDIHKAALVAVARLVVDVQHTPTDAATCEPRV